MNRIISIIVAISILLSLFGFHLIEEAESQGVSNIVWISADWHCDIEDKANAKGIHWHCDWGDYTNGNTWDAVNDTNDMKVDYAWIVGDCISWFDAAAGYPGVPEAWRRFGIYWSNLTIKYAKNFTIGNHDGRFFDEDDTDTPYDLGLPRSQGTGGEWYNFTIGNTSSGGVKFICMADEDTADGSQSGNGVVSQVQYDWVNRSIWDAYNNSLNVFIFMHQKHSGWFSGSESSSIVTGKPINTILNYWNNQRKPVSLYSCGHSHDTALNNNDWIEVNYGTNCMLVGSLAFYSSDGGAHYPQSRYLYFTNESTSVTIKTYNHTGNVFNDAVEYTFDMLYPWNPVYRAVNATPPVYMNLSDFCGFSNGSNISSKYTYWGNFSDPVHQNINVSGIHNNSLILDIERYEIEISSNKAFSVLIANEVMTSKWFNLTTDISNRGNMYVRYRAYVKVRSP